MTRRGRRGDDAQAVLETALVLPILLFLVCNFVAVMVQVTVQQQLNAATALAAQSRFQAPNNAAGPVGYAMLRRRRCEPRHVRSADGMQVRGRVVLRNDADVHRHAAVADRCAVHIGWRQR